MSSVSTTSGSGTGIAALVNAATADSTPPVTSPTSATSTDSSNSDRGPATNVELSDKVKAVLARAKTDQSVADQLKAFVKHRHHGAGSPIANGDSTQTADSDPSQTSSDLKTDIDKVFQTLTAGKAQTVAEQEFIVPDSTSFDKEFQELTTGKSQTAGAEQASDPFIQPAISFQGNVQFDGFSLSVTANAKDGTFETDINGPDGATFFQKTVDASAGASAYSGVGYGVWNAHQIGNVEYVTFNPYVEVASVSSSSANGAVSASAVSAYSSSVGFAIDFTTGSIRSASSVTALSASAVSVLA